MAFLNKLSSIPKKIKISSFYRFFPLDIIYGPPYDFANGSYRFGAVLKINTDGNKIVIGALPQRSSFNGLVKIYSKINEEWVQEGSDITGPYSFGRGVAINSAGNRIAAGDFAAGTAKIYELNNSEWVQLGNTISGVFGFGEALAMNAVGDRIIIGNYRGVTAAVFSWDGTQWTQLGTSLSGSGTDQFGFKVAMSADGNIIAISAAYGSFPFPEIYRCGYTKIYSWNGSQWTQMGQTIYGSAEKDNLGFGLSMNAAGDKIILGAHGNYTFYYPDNPQSNLTGGYARVYYWNATTSTWIKLGADIFGRRQANDTFGSSVSMNQIGDKVIIAENSNYSPFTASSLIYIYRYNGTNWIKKGPSLIGGSDTNAITESVTINSNGDTIAFGSENKRVKVYKDYFANTWIAKSVVRKWYDVAMSSNGSIQVAVIYAINDNTSQVYISEDFGQTWTSKTPEITQYWYSVAMTSNGSKIYATKGANLLLSTDLGSTWVASGAIGANTMNTSVATSSDGTVTVVVGDNDQPRITINSGATWFFYDSQRKWSSVAISSDGSRMTGVVGYAGVAGKIYVSTNFGQTWVAKDSDRLWQSVAMSSDGRVQTAVGTNTQIYVSTDFGDTWVAKDSSRIWQSVAMSSDGKVQTAVVYGGQVYTSINSGDTWVAKDSDRLWSSVAISSDGSVQTTTVFDGNIYILN